jgi:hypothetical protein
MRNQTGFSKFGILLIPVVAGIIGGAGCHTSGARHGDDKGMSAASKASAPGSERIGSPKGLPAEIDETADWTPYVSVEGAFSLRHPKNWIRPTEPDRCTPGLFMAGGDASSVGECASEYFGQIYVSSTEGDHLDDYKLAPRHYWYQDISSRKLTVDNVEGVRETGTAMGQTDEKNAMPGLPNGAKVVVYYFYAHGKTYVAQYTQESGHPDVLRDFDLMVIRTLKFSN